LINSNVKRVGEYSTKGRGFFPRYSSFLPHGMMTGWAGAPTDPSTLAVLHDQDMSHKGPYRPNAIQQRDANFQFLKSNKTVNG
jgi:hypothetical protein